jgi:cytosine/adenosine deaminase-related metal-dependent hydrolase
MAGEVGELSPGAWADLVAVTLPPGAGMAGVEEAVLASGRADVLGTWVGGRPVFRRAGVTAP